MKRRCIRAPAGFAFVLAIAAAPTQAGAAPLRGSGSATVASVDGPARLTIKTKRGKLRIRLFSIDTPQVGECGAAKSVAALTRLVRRKAGRLRYELIDLGIHDYERDRDGRYLASIAPAGQDVFFGNLGQGLVTAGWARYGDQLSPTQPRVEHGLTTGGASAGGGPPETPRGVWAQCGGRLHLPIGQPIPATAPATWTINADGVTEAVGPLALSATLSPSTNLTVAKVAAVAPVELLDVSNGQCRAWVPSLQVVLSAETRGSQPCGSAEVFAIASSGPGAAKTTRGVGVGTASAAFRAAFPRATVLGDDGPEGALGLSGDGSWPWAWQTQVGIHDRSGTVDILSTAAGR